MDNIASSPLQRVHGVGGQVEFKGLRAKDQLHALRRAAVGENCHNAAVGVAKAGVSDLAGRALPCCIAYAVGGDDLRSAANVLRVVREGPVLAAARDLVGGIVYRDHAAARE